MTDHTTPPIKVGANAGLIDTLTAAGRYLVAIVTAVPILMTLLGQRDLVSIIAYFQSAEGTTLIAAIGGLVTIGYGLFKTRKRGAQLANVAADDRVPASVASIK